MKQTTPIAQTVEPLKIHAENYAAELAQNTLDQIAIRLAEFEGDYIKFAPRPRNNMSRREYVQIQEFHNLVWRLTVRDEVKMQAQGYRPNPTQYRLMDEATSARFIKEYREQAAASFEAFVAKLNDKVGPHTAATMVIEGTWSNSLFAVTKADGTVERWHTQRIMNVSVLGKLFHQWPTRKVK